jgi:heterodisulfide reductase subunit B
LAEKLVQCPGCALMLSEDDAAGQVAHMREEHSDIVDERLAEAGFEYDGERWIDLLVDEGERDSRPEEFERFIEKHGEHMLPPDA